MKHKIISVICILIGLVILCSTAAKDTEESFKAEKIYFPEEEMGILEESNAIAAAEKKIDEGRFRELEAELKEMLSKRYGNWSVYIKNLSTDNVISINNEPIYAASLIKLFVMEHVYQEMDTLVSYGHSEEKIRNTLDAMITVSDNNAYNNLVSMHSPSGSFYDGCLAVNEDLQKSEYTNTGIYHTLHPCYSPWIRTGATKNHTTAEDCGKLLEAIYDGTCVSKEASAEMLDLLLQQQRTGKIPAGVPDDVVTANKTGETDTTQHDAAIVFGPKTDYVICIMSSYDGGAISVIQNISKLVYEYLS